ncbi:hypothetical protein GQ55_2G257200 [Panicum hallii var. hallii]|uniref:Uncharacterized protein n=1 Tax=Panicum hallii var. hallii TaxID=1504633 RepID=A0A2T7ESB5_9POAL|nr:hypothetical protein GQ55_2G257200 [Panicum hallii var. hallii]
MVGPSFPIERLDSISLANPLCSLARVGLRSGFLLFGAYPDQCQKPLGSALLCLGGRKLRGCRAPRAADTRRTRVARAWSARTKRQRRPTEGQPAKSPERSVTGTKMGTVPGDLFPLSFSCRLGESRIRRRCFSIDPGTGTVVLVLLHPFSPPLLLEWHFVSVPDVRCMWNQWW